MRQLKLRMKPWLPFRYGSRYTEAARTLNAHLRRQVFRQILREMKRQKRRKVKLVLALQQLGAGMLDE